jgi:hypothetical protein
VEKSKKLEAQLTTAQEKMRTLEKTNSESYHKLEAMKKLKEQFEAENEVALPESEKVLAKMHYDAFLLSVRQSLDRACRRTGSRNVYISVDQLFNLNEKFQTWYQMYHKDGPGSADPGSSAFLFDPFSSISNTSTIAQLQHQVVQLWKVRFKGDIANREARKWEEMAKDGGGPTRHFFNRIWIQLGDLAVTLPAKDGENITYIKLFEETKSGLLLPQSNEQLEYMLRNVKNEKERESILKQVEAYFRAVGRIVAHSMLLSEENFGPIVIANHVLPALYKAGK